MPRPMPMIGRKTPDEVRINRVKLRDCPSLVKNMCGVRVTKRTVLNWMQKGLHAYSNVRVVLKHEIVLGKYDTTKADLREFIEEMNK